MRYIALLWLAGLCLLSGCGSYALRGTVVEGKASMILVVDENDPRLAQPGLGEAGISLTLQPRDIHPKPQGSTGTDSQGRFSLPVREGGAGFLEFEAMIVAQKAGYQSAWVSPIPLPGGNQRLLIILAPGWDTNPPPVNVLQETIDMGRKFQMQ